MIGDALSAPDPVDLVIVQGGVEVAPRKWHPDQVQAQVIGDKARRIRLVAGTRAIRQHQSHQRHGVKVSAAKGQCAGGNELVGAHGIHCLYIMSSQSVMAPQKRAHSSRLNSV